VAPSPDAFRERPLAAEDEEAEGWLSGGLAGCAPSHPGDAASGSPGGSPLGHPSGGRVLSLDSWQEVVRWATTLGVDLRDLTGTEFAYLERVTVKTAADWRSKGEGPRYRCQGYILYPLADLHMWRRSGRQNMVGQRQRKGRRAT
jgi:hypothetical protein